jgi:kynurenine formamidase
MESKLKIIDLSVSIENGLPVDPPHQMPEIEYITHETEESWQTMRKYFPHIAKDDLPEGMGWATEILRIRTHVGTHMDAPWHYHPTMNKGEAAWTIDQVPLEWCMGDGVMVDFSDKPDGYVCTSQDFLRYFANINYRLKAGDILLLQTGAQKEWGKAGYMSKGCGVGREGTLWLCGKGVHTVGTDAWSWDPPLSIVSKRFEESRDKSIIWEGHKAGLEKAYLQIEKLTNLDKLPPFGFKVIALPVKIAKASAGWVRAVALISDGAK